MLRECCCTQRNTVFESLSTDFGKVLWQGHLCQRPTMREDLRVHNVHLCLLRQTKSSSQQNVLLSPISGSCSNTAFSNSWRRSNSWSSIVSWVSSPANVANIKQIVIDLSSLHCEVDTEMWSAIMVKSPLHSNAHLFSSQKVLRQTSIRLTFLATATGC